MNQTMNYDGISAFLAQNAVKVENQKVVVSKRFVDGENNPVPFEIRALRSTDDDELRKLCTKKVQVPGKPGRYSVELDTEQYLGMVAAACTVYPNLGDAVLQDSYEVISKEELLKKMLLPGEYTEYLKKVNQINGFDVNLDDLVEDAKN